mgnify:CR=1 FL=1
MVKYFEENGFVLYHGDCMDVLKNIENIRLCETTRHARINNLI